MKPAGCPARALVAHRTHGHTPVQLQGHHGRALLQGEMCSRACTYIMCACLLRGVSCRFLAASEPISFVFAQAFIDVILSRTQRQTPTVVHP